MNLLESRKRILLAESELNRAHLVTDAVALTADLRALADRAHSLWGIAASAAMLVAGLAAFRPFKAAPADTKPSWLRSLVKGAGLVSTLWLAFRARGREQTDK